jgi:hypothetical protein
VLAALALLAAFALGRLALSATRAERHLTALETNVFSLAAGLSLCSLLTLALGLFGLLHEAWLFRSLLLAATVVWGYRRYSGSLQKAGGRDPGEPAAGESPEWLPARAAWLALPFVAVILLGGMLPPWEFDVREYHLQVPKEWYQAGRISFLPHNVYGNMPLGAEMHALLSMALIGGERAWWWGALAGKTIIAGFALLTSLALFAAGCRLANRTAGLIAALTYISVPWVTHVSVSGLIEGAFGCYAFLAVHALLVWDAGQGDQSGGGRSPRRGLLLLAGFFAGSAAACKYPALLFVVAPVAGYVFLRPLLVPHLPAWPTGPHDDLSAPAAPLAKQSGRDAAGSASRRVNVRATVLVLLATLAASGLWLAKNAWQTGNPIYPLVFGGQTRSPARMAQWNQAHRVPVDDRGRRHSVGQAADAVARFAWRSRWQSPLLLPLALMAAWARRQRRAVCLLALYAAFYLLAWWIWTHRIERFWVPLLPVVCLLAGIGVAWCSAKPWKATIVAVLGLGMTGNLLFNLSSPNQDHRYLVALDYLRVDMPADEQAVSRVKPVHRWLNRHADEVRRVLLVGDAEPFDLEVPVLYNTCFDECLFEKLFRGRTRDQRRAALRARGISHIYFDWSEFDR